MIHSSKAGRTAAVVIVILVVAAGATAGIRWKQWRPVNVCLMCDTPEMDGSTTASAAGSGPVAGTAGAFASPAGGSTVASPADVVRPRASADGGMERSNPAAARGAWQPWGAGTGSFKGYSSSGQAPEASLGGLWRLMNFMRLGNAPVDTIASTPPAPTTRPERPALAPKPPAPPATTAPPAKSAPPAAGPRPPAPTPPAPPPPAPAPEPSPAPAPAPAPPSAPTGVPTDPFHENEKPLPDPFDEQPPDGPLDPGGPGGEGPGGDLSPTPEPGSILLLGTGLAGILGVLRRRRLL